MKSTKTALAITLMAVVIASLFGAHRSLSAIRKEALVVFEQGAYGVGHGVASDLEKQQAVCANVNTVAARNLSPDDADLRALGSFFDKRYDDRDPKLTQAEREAAYRVLDALDGLDTLSDKDRGYVSGFRAELQSLELTIAHDPYNDLAEDFNRRTLAAFPANFLGWLTGVDPLNVYR